MVVMKSCIGEILVGDLYIGIRIHVLLHQLLVGGHEGGVLVRPHASEQPSLRLAVLQQAVHPLREAPRSL